MSVHQSIRTVLEALTEPGVYLYTHPARVAPDRRSKGTLVREAVLRLILQRGFVRSISGSKDRFCLSALGKAELDIQVRTSKHAAPRCETHKTRGRYCECGVVIYPCCEGDHATCYFCREGDAVYRKTARMIQGRKRA